ncbi:MAG: peptidoglycan-binding domain-containing protein [Proteobacteria bacterium]|nr:peptidoglycan-binding domain-containing protein [Pseudomonadota bacterium]
MSEPSGAQWCSRFPGSALTDDLLPDFRDATRAFISRMQGGGAHVSVAATYRPPERAYLMHWCCRIAGYKDKNGVLHIDPPSAATSMAGVNIDWTHGDDTAAAKSAAQAMVTGYAIKYPAALVSRHTQRRAIDMTISWTGTLAITDFNAAQHTITTDPRDGSNPELIKVGKTFGVIKLLSDPPHWSDDGH